MVSLDEIKSFIGISNIDPSLKNGANTCPACGKKNKAHVYADQHIKCWSAYCELNKRHDLVSYYAWKNNLELPRDFKVVVRDLASIAGIENKGKIFDKRSVFFNEILSIYEHYLWSEEGKDALEYMRGRGFDDLTLKINRIGFAPDSTCLRMFDIDTSLLKEYGMLKSGREYFEGRIIFPIIDWRNNVIHFTGRYLGTIPTDIEGNDIYPRYKDSKGEPGIKNYLALENKLGTSNKNKPLHIVEGFPDAMFLDQFGLQTVGVLGLEKLANHVRKIERFKEVIFIFDNDKFEEGPNKGLYKSWLRVLPQIMHIGQICPLIKFYVWMVPEVVERENRIIRTKDINEWGLAVGDNPLAHINSNKVPLVKYCIDSYIDNITKHGDLIKLLNSTQDEEYFMSRNNKFREMSPIKYMKEVLL